MNNAYPLSDKFAPAKLPETCAPRHALINLFHKETGKRVIYVSAPAGYGKTVSTQLWLKNSGRIPVWIGLDEYDNTPSIFYKLICTGVLSLQPENKAMEEILASPSFNASPVEHTIHLLSEFAPDGRQYAIVLDDMHLVSNEEIRKSGLLVRKRLPSSIVLVTLTRNEIAEKYISLIGEEKCAVITAQDLAFSVEEIQKYFGAFGRFITAEEAEAVYAITNGWAIGVNALAISGQIELEQSGGQVLGNYIKSQVWDKWDEALQTFLLKTSVPDEITPELAEKLTGEPDSRNILERLCDTNSFVSRLWENTYRYHHLFLDFLRGMLNENKFDLKTLHKIVAEFYMEQGEYFIARRYAMISEDPHLIGMITNYHSQYRSASLDEFADFAKLYINEGLPESICEKAPDLYAVQMWENFLLGNAAKMEHYMDKIYQSLPAIAQRSPQLLKTVLMQITLDHRSSIYELVERITLFPPMIPSVADPQDDAPQAATLTHEMPFLHRSNRDYYELADEELRHKISIAGGYLFSGNMDIFLSAIECGLLLEKNLQKEALACAQRTIGLLGENTSDEFRFSSFMHLAAVYLAMGNMKYEEVLAETEDFIKKNDAHYLNPNFLACKSKVKLLDGDKSAALSWLENYFVVDTEDLELYKIFQHFTTARAYMALAQTNKAMDYITKLKKLATDFRRPLDIAEANVLQAILEWATASRREALETLEEALTAMQEYGFVRVFADEGAAILPILKKLALNLKKAGCQSTLNAHFLNEVTIAAYEQSRRYKGISANIRPQKPVKLSKQQKHMITLLAKGYKNAEIVDITGLTIHTVKSHQAAAYAKLDVNSAMDAVIKARELGLIE